MHTLFFFMTKPRLSQAEALLLPKDFVSLNISKVIQSANQNVNNRKSKCEF